MLSDDPRAVVRGRVKAVVPFDERESADQADILGWIDSGAPLFRTVKPATPHRHLAVYFALLDEASRSVLLVDHLKARAWLLPGGHVDEDEDPAWSVEREAFEELQVTPKFHERLGDGQPAFLSVNQTRGEHSHIDVTLWFAFAGDSTAEVHPDPAEFSDIRWFSLDDEDWLADRFDPQMSRFVSKVTSALANPALDSKA